LRVRGNRHEHICAMYTVLIRKVFYAPLRGEKKGLGSEIPEIRVASPGDAVMELNVSKTTSNLDKHPP
jgi:hypothetical protein